MTSRAICTIQHGSPNRGGSERGHSEPPRAVPGQRNLRPVAEPKLDSLSFDWIIERENWLRFRKQLAADELSSVPLAKTGAELLRPDLA